MVKDTLFLLAHFTFSKAELWHSDVKELSQQPELGGSRVSSMCDP